MSMDYTELLCQERVRVFDRKTAAATDRRTEFEKDYHRIIGSASFRRLQDKTQVFALDNSDFIRTRLTHSLEVSSLAKSLGQSAGNMLVDNGYIDDRQARDMSDILLCAGLIHDIGNPPFGHFGEMVIRDWYRSHLTKLVFRDRPVAEYLTRQQLEDLCNFEGNAQSLRVVAKLHHLVNEYGMNLTLGVLNTIIKYPTPSDGIDKKSGDIRLKKMGYFQADAALFERVTRGTGAGSCRHPLTFLLEAADDVAYSTADIEDGYKKGVLTFEKLRELLSDNRFLSRKGEKEYEGIEYAISRLDSLYKRGRERGELDPEGYAIQNWTVSLQSYFITSACASFLEHQKELLEGTYRQDIFEGTSSQYLIAFLKETAAQHIFCIDSIVKQEIAAGNILGSLMDQLVAAAIPYDTDQPVNAIGRKLMQIVSPNYLKHYEVSSAGLSEGEKLYLRLVLVNDFIAGMTDSYAKSLYQELMGL